jgi:predicted GIY-YIG superfamily endonuclease
MFFVYILESKIANFHYVGLTRKLRVRISEHKLGESPATKFCRPLKLVWYCVFASKYTAARFEKYLKSGSGRAFAKKHLFTLADEVTA